MTINVERYILEALQKGVTLAVGTSIPVKYVNTNFKAPSNGKWWEVVYIPNNVTDEFWDEGKTFQGVLRLILHWPQSNTGAYLAMDEMKRVADSFIKGNIYTDPLNQVRVKIQEHPNCTGVLEQSPEFLLPLTIRYSCFKI